MERWKDTLLYNIQMSSDMQSLEAGGSRLPQTKRFGPVVDVIYQATYRPGLLPWERKVFTGDSGFREFFDQSLR